MLVPMVKGIAHEPLELGCVRIESTRSYMECSWTAQRAAERSLLDTRCSSLTLHPLC